LADFLQLRGIPQISMSFLGTRQVARASYQGAYPVLNATSYEAVLRKVGDRIELIGRIDSVVKRWGANRKPYVFVNFSDWRGNAVKLCIWSQALSALGTDVPDESWTGKWITISGLVDTPYRGKSKSGVAYTHVSISVSQRGQMQVIGEEEAKYRLDARAQVGRAPQNADIVRNMGGASISSKTNTLGNSKPMAPVQHTVSPKTGNQQVLERMRVQAVTQLTALQSSKPTQSAQALSSPTRSQTPSSSSAARAQIPVFTNKVTGKVKKKPALLGRWILLALGAMFAFILIRR
jgi:hypothetical protein